MPRGKPFICWIGENNSTALHVGDECELKLNGGWIRGRIGYKRSGSCVFRAGIKEYPVWFITMLRPIDEANR